MPIDNEFNKSQYSKNAELYLESNQSGDIGGGTPETRVKLLQRFLPQGRHIFEIGAGGGEEAFILQKAGYKVTASDFVGEFVRKMRGRGLNAIEFDAKADEFPKDIDAIYANAVLVHFSPEETASFLERAKRGLANEKIIFMSVIRGEGFERSARARSFERDFYYYELDDISKILEEQKYEVIYSDNSDPKWLQVVGKVI